MQLSSARKNDFIIDAWLEFGNVENVVTFDPKLLHNRTLHALIAQEPQATSSAVG